MRKIEMHVPTEVIGEFATELTDREMDNTILGATEDDEIIIEVMYDKSEGDKIDELEEILEGLIDGMDTEEEEEEEENEED